MTCTIVVGKEVVPPVPGEAEIRQLASERAQRLVRVPAGQKTLEPQPGVAADHVGQLGDRLL